MDLRIAKGLETKQLIYDTAKKEFYQNGYKKTTIQTVTLYAGVQRGLFAYYFGGIFLKRCNTFTTQWL